jgi:hypothetical protein
MGVRHSFYVIQRNQLDEYLAGWKLPAPPVGPPHKRMGENPFTREKIEVWEYEMPDQPEANNEVGFPERDDAPCLNTKDFTSSELGRLVELIDGTDERAVCGLLESQALVGPHEAAEESHYIYLVPDSIRDSLAAVNPERIEELADKWCFPPKKRSHRVRRPLASEGSTRIAS